MKRLTHEEALNAIDAGRDGSLEPDLQQALDEHLAVCRDCRAYQVEFVALENRLAKSLQERWPANPADERQIASVLENIPSHTRQKTMQPFLSKTVRTLAWGTLAIALVALLGWGIQSLRPAPAATSAVETGLPTVVEATAQEIIPTQAPSEAPTQLPADTPVPPQGVASGMPGIQFTFETALPTAPDQVTLYHVQLSEAVNADSARQMAERWGMPDAKLYNTGSSESPSDILLDASDGVNLMRFINFADQFLYWPNYASVLNDNGPILPFDQQVTIATQYLKDRGMLNEPYRVMPVVEERSKVRFVQLLDERPLLYGIGTNRGSTEWIDVALDSAGQVSEVDFAQHNFQAIGEFPILSAEQAWERFTSDPNLRSVNYAVLGAERPVTYQSWARNQSYQPGQSVDIYGYVGVMQPVSPADPASVEINNLTVNADASAFSTANPWDFIHLWGEIVQQDNGGLAIGMDGWEVSLLSDDTLTGTLQRQGDQGLFTTNAGSYILPDLPENFPDGAQANVRGVVMQGNPPAFEWSNIDTGEIPFYYGTVMSCGGGGGGGGGGPENANFGGGSLRGLNLSGQPIEQTPVAGGALAPGDNLEAVSGTPYITIYQYASGLEKENVTFYPDAGSGLDTSVVYALEGAVVGVNLTPNLPVRIWGQVDRIEAETSTVVINVTRYEAVYPGVQIQQWNGTEAVVNVDGRDVVLLTTSDGQTYVVGASLQWNAQDMLIGVPGDLVGIEGYILPDQLYGGYAVIKDLGGEMPPDDLLQSAEPSVIDQTMTEEYSQAQYLVGEVTIESVELAYRSISLQRCTSDFASYPDSEQSLTVQPVWVFTGHFADGRQFQLQVQALPDQYLH